MSSDGEWWHQLYNENAIVELILRNLGFKKGKIEN